MTPAIPVIAFVGPLTGGESVAARPKVDAVRRGAEAAAARLGVRVEVIGLDDAREPGRAAAIMSDLANDSRVIGVVGPKNSGSARAAIPVARKHGLPMLLPAATATDLCDLGKGWVFRLCATDADTAAATAALCSHLRVLRLAVRADDTPYGRGLAENVGATVRYGGVQVVPDLADGDAVFHAMGKVEQAEAIRAARSGGFEGLLLGAEGGPGAVLGALAGGTADGAYQLYAGAVTPEVGSAYTSEARDAADILLQAWVMGGDRGSARDVIAAGSWAGVTGTVRFDLNGERIGPAVTVWRVDGADSVHDASATAAVANLSSRRDESRAGEHAEPPGSCSQLTTAAWCRAAT